MSVQTSTNNMHSIENSPSLSGLSKALSSAMISAAKITDFFGKHLISPHFSDKTTDKIQFFKNIKFYEHLLEKMQSSSFTYRVKELSRYSKEGLIELATLLGEERPTENFETWSMTNQISAYIIADKITKGFKALIASKIDLKAFNVNLEFNETSPLNAFRSFSQSISTLSPEELRLFRKKVLSGIEDLHTNDQTLTLAQKKETLECLALIGALTSEEIFTYAVCQKNFEFASLALDSMCNQYFNKLQKDDPFQYLWKGFSIKEKKTRRIFLCLLLSKITDQVTLARLYMVLINEKSRDDVSSKKSKRLTTLIELVQRHYLKLFGVALDSTVAGPLLDNSKKRSSIYLA